MNSSIFKRSKARVDKALKLAGESLIAMEPLRIHIPVRFAERNLAVIEDVSYVLGFAAIITEDNYYASSMVPSMWRTEPDRVGQVVVDDIPYIELSYEKGSSVIANVNLVMVDNMIHRVWMEMYGKAKVPWYYNYEDVIRMFFGTGKYNGVKLGYDRAILEYAAAAVCRDPDDTLKFYRQRPNAKSDFLTKPPVLIGLRNVALQATNFTARTAGSYSDDGLTVSLVNPSDRAERIETMLRQ